MFTIFSIFDVMFASLAYNNNVYAFNSLYTVTYPYYAFQEDSECELERQKAGRS